MLGVSKTSSEDEIRNAYERLKEKHDPLKYLDMKHKDRHRQLYFNVETAYQTLLSEQQMDVFNPRTNMRHKFDIVFEEMERRVNKLAVNEPNEDSFYSKKTLICTRNGKTVTQIEENINGDIKRFESYDTRKIKNNVTIDDARSEITYPVRENRSKYSSG